MRSRRINFSRRVGAAALVLVGALVVWVGSALFFGGPGAALKRAGSERIAGPITPLKLVAAMAPPGAEDQEAYQLEGSVVYSDEEIQAGIKAKLEEMQLPADPLKIQVHERHVELEGPVADALLRDAIEITVRAVPGVRTVDNRLDVVKADAPKDE